MTNAHSPKTPEPQSVQTLFAEALRETTDLARNEIALFRTEMSENVRHLFVGLGMLVGAAAFVIASLILLTQALVKWLATVVNSEALASLIVGVAMAVIAIGLALYGRRAASASALTPTRTAVSLKRDAEVVSERVS
jgi:Putative Actinobacterial Holin-X, holin superfamily III